MKTLIVYHSEHHMNTKKIANVIAPVLDASLVVSPNINTTDLREYDLIGFGSGIYYGKFHEELYTWVNSLPQQNGKKAFLFSSTGSKTNGERAHERFRSLLGEKGFDTIGDFSCLGFDTALSSDGINKGRPNANDLKNAERFAANLVE